MAPARGATAADFTACRDYIREYGRTFYFASQFLPAARRRAMYAAYAYCRIADDIVDRAPAAGAAAAAGAIDAWEAQLVAPTHPIAVAFADVRRRYGVPLDAVRDLLAGVRMDLAPRPYEDWEALRLYCYRVAGTVGLISAPILGCREAGALPRAVDLGIAMQLTNILRDVGEDARMGRLYLPLEDLAAFGCEPEAILAGRPNGRFAALMAFEIERARALYASSRAGVPALLPTAQLAILASAHLYGKILHRIEEQQYDVFATRAHVPTQRKLRAMPSVVAAFVGLYVTVPTRPRL
jgi:phytoene synthase